jgi:hypothetical protein
LNAALQPKRYGQQILSRGLRFWRDGVAQN